MNTESIPSTQRLLTVILILLSIPVLYTVYDLFFIEGRVSFSRIDLSKIPWFLQLSLSVLLIILLARRKFGVLLFTIVSAGSKFIGMLFSLQNFDDLTLNFWIFQLINSVCLVLMILLLKRENNRFFNLEFKEKPIGFEKTYRLISAFNLTFVIIQSIEFCVAIGIMIFFTRFEPTTFLNSSFALFLAMLVLTILGRVQKTKIANLAFLLIASTLLNTLLSSSYILLTLFTESWSDGWAVYALILDILLVTFGIFMFYIIRTYFKEKAGLNNQSGSDSTSNPHLLDEL